MKQTSIIISITIIITLMIVMLISTLNNKSGLATSNLLICNHPLLALGNDTDWVDVSQGKSVPDYLFTIKNIGNTIVSYVQDDYTETYSFKEKNNLNEEVYSLKLDKNHHMSLRIKKIDNAYIVKKIAYKNAQNDIIISTKLNCRASDSTLQ